MIKVLQVLGHVPIGGVGTFLINSLKNSDPEKIKFDFVMYNSLYKSDFIDNVTALGANVKVFNSYLKFNNLLKMRKEFDGYLSDNNNYNIVHLHAPNLGFIVFPIAKKYGIGVRILHSHAVKYSDSIVKTIRNYLIGLPNKFLATHYVSCSRESGRFLFGNKDFYIARNGVEIEKYKYNEDIRDSLRNAYKVKDKIVVGHIGNFLPVKNHEFLIDIFRNLYIRDDRFILFLVGDGPLEVKIKEIVMKYELSDTVRFLGRRNNVNELIQMFDILILPSKNEGFGIVAIEAQTSGLRCFVSNKVSKEVGVTDNIKFISLDATSEEWARIIFENINYKRKDESKSIQELGYDIRNTALKLQEFYSNIYEK